MYTYHISPTQMYEYDTQPTLSEWDTCVSPPWGYSSVVEHSTADREVPGSNPGVP